MSFSFENQGTNTYLVYAVGADETIDTMGLGMLSNNKIPGLAQAIFTQMDTTKYIKYNVSSHISVRQFFAGPVNKKRLLGVFNGIVDAMLSAEDYMIDVNSILIDLDYIFADVSTCETILICLPVLSLENKEVDLGIFFKNIMFGTQFDQTENCDHVAKIMNYLNSTPVFSLVDFKELLNSLEVKVTEQPVITRVQPVVPQNIDVRPHNEVRKEQVVNNTTIIETNKSPQTNISAVSNVTTIKQDDKLDIPDIKDNNVPKEKAAGEKKMTMFNLLMHYSKENAAIYKAQKEAEKAASAAGKETNASAGVPDAGFSIPGQSATNTGFAIPGQEAPNMNNVPFKANPQAKAQPVATQQAKVQPTPQPVSQPTPQPVVTNPQPVVQQNSYKVPGAPATPAGQAMNFGETTVLGGAAGIGETTVLSEMPQAIAVKPRLIRAKNNETINLNKPVFRIGKEKSYVDYFIGDNTAISRSHANVISREGQYFVTDTNSTNHTYVNGKMIQSNVEVQLADGDKIRLANEDFEFKIY